jgi:hypothetical protein
MCLRFEDGKALWRGRSPELRIRQQAAQVVEDSLPLAPRRLTADDRIAVTPPATEEDSGPLSMVVVPLPTRDGSELSARRVPPLDALRLLAAFPRLRGWRDPGVLRRQFEGLADLVNSVPVLEVTVPWGPPFQPDLAEMLWAELVRVAGITTTPN